MCIRDRSGTQRVITIQSLNYDSIKATGGETVKVEEPKETVVYRNGEESKYEDAYLNGVSAGTQALLQYSAAGELEYVFLRSSAQADTSVRVIKNRPNMSDDLPYAVYKNGTLASGSAIQQYDVTTFDAASNVMYVSDARITGSSLEGKSPSLTAHTMIGAALRLEIRIVSVSAISKYFFWLARNSQIGRAHV